MVAGLQRISILPRDVWARTDYSDRRHGGGAQTHFWRFDGKALLAVTRDELETPPCNPAPIQAPPHGRIQRAAGR